MSKLYIDPDDNMIRRLCLKVYEVEGVEQKPCEGEFIHTATAREGDFNKVHICDVCGLQDTFGSIYPRDKL